MSHSLHRRGDVEFLKKDFVVKATPAKGIDNADEEAKRAYLPKIRGICDVIGQYSINMGIGRTGSTVRGQTVEDIKKSYDKLGVVGISASVMSSREAVKGALQDLRDRDYGISICVAGLIDEVFAIGKEIGVPPHSILLSLGVWGKKDLLPAEDPLIVTAMCGHHMMASSLVEFMAEQYKSGRLSLEEAATRLARCCTCGSVNPVGVREMLQKMAAGPGGEDGQTRSL